jgi:predicted nucleic acid-binding protein
MDDVVVDACCLINLCAAGELRERLSVIGGDWYVPTAVSAESLYLHIEQADGTIDKSSLDLQPFIDDGVLLSCTAEPGAELDLYVDLATRLDDGEAMALAIAKTRSWTFSTDDRKAKRVAVELSVAVLTTPEIMKRWADSAPSNPDELREALRRIEQIASFFPSASDPLQAWWRSSMDD